MNSFLNEIIDEIMASPLGGEININASEKGKNYVKLHAWDGRRFILTCVEEPSGCEYDSSTGLPK